MAITEKTAFDALTILDDGQIQLRRARVLIDNDGVTEISRQYFRQVIEPGQDVSALPPRVRGLANFIWTPAVVAAYQAAKVARQGAL